MPTPNPQQIELARQIELPEDVLSRVPPCRCTEIFVCGFHSAIAVALARETEEATKAERERCANIAFGFGLSSGMRMLCGEVAAAIRAGATT